MNYVPNESAKNLRSGESKKSEPYRLSILVTRTSSSDALKTYLFSKGITRFDTYTAFTNKAAQHFYEKNGFINKIITRSYYKDV